MVQKSLTNSNSVITLTLGILAILIPIIGLILAVFGIFLSRKALKEIEETNENGKGLTISGLICCVIGIIIQIFFYVLGVLNFIIAT